MLVLTSLSVFSHFSKPKNHRGFFIVKENNVLPAHVCVASQYHGFTTKPSGANKTSFSICKGIFS